MARQRYRRSSVLESLEARQLLAGDAFPNHPPYAERMYEGNRAVSIGETTYFVNDDGVTGAELWRSDGTGTARVTDLQVGAQSSIEKAPLIVFQGRLYFIANDGVHGPQIWTSDGTTTGTYAISDLVIHKPWVPANIQMQVGEHAFLVACFDQPLIVSDGTSAGTRVLELSGVGQNIIDVDFGFTWRGEIYFQGRAPDGTLELWKSDGTSAGTTQLTFELALPQTAWYEVIGETATAVYFRLRPGTEESVWRTDGTSAGTARVITSTASSDHNYKLIGDQIYYSTSSPQLIPTSPIQTDLWVMSASGGTPTLLATFASTYHSTDGAEVRPQITFLKIGGETFIHVARYGQFDELWKTDGTAVGTQHALTLEFQSLDRRASLAITHIYPGQITFARIFGVTFLEDGDRLFIAVEAPAPGVHWQVWTTDGTAVGTVKLAEELITPGSPAPFTPPDGPTSLAIAAPTSIQQWSWYEPDALSFWGVKNGRLFFSVRQYYGLSGQVWSSDGTVAGTQELTNGDAGDSQGSLTVLGFVGNELIFRKQQGLAGKDLLYRSHGTLAGTRLIGTLTASADGEITPEELVNLRLKYHNFNNPHDVDNNQHLSPLDALIILIELQTSGPRRLRIHDSPSDYFDVDGDGYISPLDALLVINAMNARQTLASPNTPLADAQGESSPAKAFDAALAAWWHFDADNDDED